MGQVVGQDTTYMGNPATFTGIAGSVITELNTDIDPVQDLHGYSKPWPAGGGKNKIGYMNTRSSLGIDFTYNADGSTTINGTCSGGTSFQQLQLATYYTNYTLYPAGSYKVTGATGVSTYYLSVVVVSTDGTVGDEYYPITENQTITLASPAYLCPRYVVTNGTHLDNVKVWPMIRNASIADDTWEPYENICPITGWTGANVNRTGKNLCRVARGWSSNQGITYTENADGTVHAKGTATAESFSAGSITGSVSNIDSRCMYTVPAGTYTISNIAGVRLWVQFRNADNTAQTETNVNIAVGASKTVTFTEPAIIYIRSDIATGTVVDTDMQVMVTEGSTAATVYEPWQKQTVTVDWTSVAGTVYHGHIDVFTGQLVVDYAEVDLGTLTYTQASTNTAGKSRWAIYNLPIKGVASSAVGNGLSSAYSIVSNTNTWNNVDGIALYNTGSSNVVYLYDEALSASTPNAVKTALSGVQLVYELDTPVEYQLTPQVITALIGPNYIWTDLNNTVTLTVRAPMNGFAGWLIKAVTNGTPIEIPLKYIRAETYTVTPDQRMEWSAERDVTGVLHRETVQNLPPKIEFNTPLMTNADINTLNGIIRAAFTNYLQRNITIQFYDPERDQYWEWDCYMPDVHYSIRNADTVNHVINYEELRYAFIGR